MQRTVVVAGSLVLLLAGCGQAPESAELVRVESPGLDMALADLPADCVVTADQGLELELSCDLDGAAGVVTFALGEPERGVNLVALAEGQKEWFEAQPEGVYKGNRELITPTGTAYTARGRYLEGGQATEETRVLMLHPTQRNRSLTVRFRYPEGDVETTRARVDQVLLLVGEIEGLGEEEPAAAEGEEAAGEGEEGVETGVDAEP